MAEARAATETELKKQACRLKEQCQKIHKLEDEKTVKERQEAREDCPNEKLETLEEVRLGETPKVRQVTGGGQAASSPQAAPPVALQRVREAQEREPVLVRAGQWPSSHLRPPWTDIFHAGKELETCGSSVTFQHQVAACRPL